MSERTDGDDFEYLLQVMRRKIRSFDTSKYLKSSKISEELKLKGTDALKHKKLSEALELYNQVSSHSTKWLCHNNNNPLLTYDLMTGTDLLSYATVGSLFCCCI